MTETRKAKQARWLWIVGAIVVVAVVTVVLTKVVGGDSADEAGTDGAAGTSDEATAPENTDDTPATTGGTGFDTPTQDYLGRRVMTPNNPAGESLGNAREVSGDVCSDDEQTTPADVSIQGTLPVTLWSTEDGPSQVDDGVPTGYSKSPRGAVLAVWNYWTLMNRTDQVGLDILENHVDLTDEQESSLEEEDRDTSPVDPEDAAMKQIAPAAYRVTSCSNDYIVFDVARTKDFSDSGERLSDPEYTALRMAAVWEDDDWKLQLDSVKNSPLAIDNIEGWTRWTF